MKQNFKTYWKRACSDWNYIFKAELRNMVKDQGVIIFFLLVPLAYPILYSFIYTNETVREVPAVVVDYDGTATSREYVRDVDATADVKVVNRCADLDEAKERVKHREAYGIIVIPQGFSRSIVRGEQTSVRVFCDMSGLLYYKALLAANTDVSLKMNARIKVAKAGSMTEQQDEVTHHPIEYEEVSLYNPTNGFAAFLIPAVLILIIQQTMLLGVGIAAGTAREQNRFHELMPINRHYRGLFRIVLGKSWAYLLVYLPISVYVLGVVTHLFRLNQIGNPMDIALFTIPFLLACIFFAMTLSGVMRQRETCIMIIVFSSVLLLFISGVSWPETAVPPFWKAVSCFFPSTFGINGYLKINNMGSPLSAVQTEWYALWVQALVYFFTTCWVYRASIIGSHRRFLERYYAQKAKSKLSIREF